MKYEVEITATIVVAADSVDEMYEVVEKMFPDSDLSIGDFTELE